MSDEAWAAYFQPRSTPPRLALLRTGLWDEADAAQQANFIETAEALRAAGAEIIESGAMGDARAMFDTTNLIVSVEAAEIFSPLIEAQPEKVSERLRALAAAGQTVSASAYQAALAARKEWQTSLSAELGGFDAVLSLPAPGAAPEGLDDTGSAMFCASWTLLGWPTVTIPAGRTKAGLPLGLQLSTTFGRDMELLRAADWAQAVIKPVERMAA
jgi:Asp-tRNA(Asn)/Glu-tRNA(Gln) amidotransferase A subunit family amidase